jgi:predicted RNA-binding protein YlqC (UPF0109 family)
MASQSLHTTTFNFPVPPKDLGHFIGKNGSNFKKMIADIKKKILGVDENGDVPAEKWNTVTITLKFEKQDTDCLAILGCASEEQVRIVQEVLEKYSKIHNEQDEFYKKKSKAPKILIFRIGASHRLIGKLIGIGGSNVNKLKKSIQIVEGVEDFPRITIEEQRSRLTGNFRNMGERNSTENIIVKVSFMGSPEFEKINKIMEEFVEKHTTEESEDESDPWGDTNSYEDSSWGSEPASEPAPEPASEPAPEPASEPAPEPAPEPDPEPELPRSNRGWEKQAQVANLKVLGLGLGATKKDVKRAYRKLAVKHHPDKGGDEERFKIIQEAYENLTDPTKNK